MYTRHFPALLLWALLLVSCDSSTQGGSPRRGSNDTEIRSMPGRPLVGHRFVAIGDFNGDGRADTLAEHFVDRSNGCETFKHCEDEEYEAQYDRLAQQWPHCYIACTTGGIDRIRPGLVAINTVSDIESDSTSIAEGILALVRLPAGTLVAVAPAARSAEDSLAEESTLTLWRKQYARR